MFAVKVAATLAVTTRKETAGEEKQCGVIVITVITFEATDRRLF